MVKLTAESFLGHILACVDRGDRAHAEIWAGLWQRMVDAGRASFMPVDPASVPARARQYMPKVWGLDVFRSAFGI